MNKTSPWLANLWHHFAAPKLHRQWNFMLVAKSQLFGDALLEGRLVPKGKDEAFRVPSLPNENSAINIHLFGYFLILSPRKYACFTLLYITWKALNTFQMRNGSPLLTWVLIRTSQQSWKNKRLYLQKRRKQVSFSKSWDATIQSEESQWECES